QDRLRGGGPHGCAGPAGPVVGRGGPREFQRYVQVGAAARGAERALHARAARRRVLLAVMMIRGSSVGRNSVPTFEPPFERADRGVKRRSRFLVHPGRSRKPPTRTGEQQWSMQW